MNENDQLNNLLKWGIENSASSRSDPAARVNTDPPRTAGSGLSAQALAQLLGGPSDADHMRNSMAAILAPTSEVSQEDKMVAWDNFEQLIETIDNANNMETLKLWTPLIQQLDSEVADNRMMACWCIGTAVQNNTKAQERVHAYGATKRIVALASGEKEKEKAVRKKAILALSSSVRNYQPNLDAALQALPADFKPEGPVDASDMEAIDGIIQKLRDQL